jgi:hypothetical protein
MSAELRAAHAIAKQRAGKRREDESEADYLARIDKVRPRANRVPITNEASAAARYRGERARGVEPGKGGASA